uniref:G-protein coupled receptors family 1 profile domain-containing protein n=1 Tax=Nomascus leucogenys TaxID=61853 RepID=A0A2I3GX65_NOMLE
MEVSLNHPSCQPPSPALFLLFIAYTVVLIKQRKAQHFTSILIANLSLSDILVCVMCIPFTIIYTLMDHWIFGDTMCRLTSYVQSVSISVSIFSLVFIAVGRYQLIVNPRGWKPSVTHAYWSITLIWLLSLLLSIPFFLSYHLTDEPFLNLSLPTDLYTHQVACVENWPSKKDRLLFTTSLFLLQCFVPLGFILICSLKIVICLRRRNAKVDKKKENEIHVIFDRYHEVLMSCHHDLVFVVCHLVAMVSTCINPLFYGFLNKNFQKDLVVLIHHCWCFTPRERYENIAISTMHIDSKRSLRLARIPTGI